VRRSREIIGYDGPTGPCIATSRGILSLDTPAGEIALAGAAVQAGIGDVDVARAVQEDVDAAIDRALRDQA
jgi:hypothetical protein